MVNRMGPRTDPCGTPYLNSCGSDVDFLIWTIPASCAKSPISRWRKPKNQYKGTYSVNRITLVFYHWYKKPDLFQSSLASWFCHRRYLSNGFCKGRSSICLSSGTRARMWRLHASLRLSPRMSFNGMGYTDTVTFSSASGLQLQARFLSSTAILKLSELIMGKNGYQNWYDPEVGRNEVASCDTEAFTSNESASSICILRSVSQRTNKKAPSREWTRTSAATHWSRAIRWYSHFCVS